MTKTEYNIFKDFFSNYIGVINMKDGYLFGYFDDGYDYSEYIDGFIEVLNRNEFIKQKNLIDEITICLEQEYKMPIIEKIINSKYDGHYGDEYFNEEIYIIFEEIFKYLNSKYNFDNTIKRMELLEFTHLGTLSVHLHEYILFKNLTYHPDMEKRTKYKVQFIKRTRVNKKSLVLNFVKIDRKKKKLNGRNKIQSNTLDF